MLAGAVESIAVVAEVDLALVAEGFVEFVDEDIFLVDLTRNRYRLSQFFCKVSIFLLIVPGAPLMLRAIKASLNYEARLQLHRPRQPTEV